MTRRALHSAVLEVGLFFQKGWSVDHIARFTFLLHHRQLRAQKAAARAQMAARGPQPERLPVAYQIHQRQADAQIAYEVAPSRAEARATNQRLVDRVRAQLSKRLSRSERTDGLGLPCSVCGEPATGWTYIHTDHDGQRVIDGFATCAAHRAEESVERVIETRAG